MRDYKKLDVWKKAHEQYMFIRKYIAVKLPKEERFELTSQLLRASLSVPLNIVEGCGRFTDKDFAHFLDNSLGSINETDYCCFAAFELKYILEEDYITVNKIVNEVRAMLISFLKFLRNNGNNPKP
ncbi:MAG: four helix bundle protein [Bacteroidota bacterium]|nr:four helix bundle protein [Bacteroidota bacterium]